MTNFSEFLLSRGAPGEVAIVDESGPHSYADLAARIARVSEVLAAAAIAPGDRVGVLGPNSVDSVAAYLGAIRAGVVPVPTSERLTADQLTFRARQLRWRAVFAGPGRGEELAYLLPVLTASGEPDSAPGPAWDANLDDDAVLMLTSGSTSEPKAVRVTHRNLIANTTSIVDYLGLTASDRTAAILPFSYCYGASLLHMTLRAGGSVVLVGDTAFPERIVEAVTTHECTVLAGVPSSFALLMRRSSFARRPLPTLRTILQAGGPLPPATAQAVCQAQPQARVFLMYGQTEATARLSYLPPERMADKLGSIGRGIPGVELTVRDDRGEPVAPGQVGEIYARGDNISPGYVDDPEQSAAKFTPLGLRTGDLARVDEEGFIYVVGRSGGFVKSWGHRVSRAEIEACALAAPGVASAVVVGVPDEDAGEAIVLFVVMTDDQAAAGAGAEGGDGAVDAERAVRRHCRRVLPHHMQPKTIRVIADVPLSANGKVDERALVALLSAR